MSISPLRSKLSHENRPCPKPNAQPLSRSTGSLTTRPSSSQNALARSVCDLDHVRSSGSGGSGGNGGGSGGNGGVVVVGKEDGRYQVGKEDGRYQVGKEDGRYQVGVDYTNRDCIDSNPNETNAVGLDFGSLTVGGGVKGRTSTSATTSNFTQCTPSYPGASHHHSMVAVSWG